MRFSDVIFLLSLAFTMVSAGVVNRRAAFTLQNGLDAQALNRKFQSLTPDSSCTDGESACVNGQLGQCAGGKFLISPCAASLQCVALPLVNKPGTSVTCDTPQDAQDRIAATGATGGLVGKREVEERSTVQIEQRAKVEHRAAFTLQNGLDAQALNRKFGGLPASSPCTAGETACVNGQLAQCVGDKFALSSCASSLQCVALPLVNKAGTSVTCDTPEDAAARISATGATGGLLGKRAKVERRAAFTLQNGLDAQALNRNFQSLTPGSACTDGETACVKGQLGQCAGGKFLVSPCAASLQCVALPLVNKPGTRCVCSRSTCGSLGLMVWRSVTCDTPEDAATRIGATGAKGGLTGTGN
ncbi:hypothetical protein EDB85DRAFT_584607 [Lactarius pseudohatsudake]|nr:hypothetical protein EDB85DRAFT_584607 [Lactarius pseudohatsudake]